jgi:hypothetical protein
MRRSRRWGLGALAAVAVAAAVVAAAVVVSKPKPTEEERMAEAVSEFIESGNRMTPDEVRRSFGEPHEVFRNNPRALCWAYDSPYQIRMCWGAKRKAPWIGHNIPFQP